MGLRTKFRHFLADTFSKSTAEIQNSVVQLESSVSHLEKSIHDLSKSQDAVTANASLPNSKEYVDQMNLIQSLQKRVEELQHKILNRSEEQRPLVWSLGGDECLTKLHFGSLMCFSGHNIDVAPGAFRDGWIEPANNLLLQDILRPGDRYINVGANFGYFTLLGAHLVGGEGEVISIEANPYIFHYLVKSVFYSGFPGFVRLHNCAVAEEAGKEYEFYFNPHFSGGGSLAGPDLKSNANHSPHIVKNIEEALFKNGEHFRDEDGYLDYAHAPFVNFRCKSNTLDAIWKKHPSEKPIRLLHMDIEGAESLAIRGAENLIKDNPELQIVMEFNPFQFHVGDFRQSIEKMYQLLKDEGFHIFQIIHPDDDHHNKRPTLKPIPDLKAMESLPHGDLYLSRSGSLY